MLDGPFQSRLVPVPLVPVHLAWLLENQQERSLRLHELAWDMLE